MEQEFLSYLTTLFKVPVVDRSKSLMGYGMDSFMSIEISDWCQTRLNVPIKQLDLLMGITVDEILANRNNKDFIYTPQVPTGTTSTPLDTSLPESESWVTCYAGVAVGALLIYYLIN